ncbi:MAG: helicase C-terminal domain-containing protein [Candidatus Binatia bacterium]
MATAAERFSGAALTALRAAIADAAGNEVLALGTLGAGIVTDVRVLARGNRAAARALLRVARAGEVVIHNHPSGLLSPSDADLSVAAVLGDNGVGSYIVDNAVESVYVVIEPHAPARPTPIDSARAAGLLAPGGQVTTALPDYEERPQQLAMLRAVATAFSDDALLSVESGTGTGKSLAYLIPALLWSAANRERVIVSTHTINLQEQLLDKDLPLLVERAGLSARVALVKGRANYLCRRKAAQAASQPAQLIDEPFERELRELLAWAERTTDGSLSDLPVRPRGEVWEQVMSENDNCLRARCPYYSSCFFYTARRTAAAADIVLVNHHLLLADLALRAEIGDYTQNGILPPSRRVIIDEAHHLADVATAHLGAAVSEATIARACARLRSPRTPKNGILPALSAALGALSADPIAAGARERIERHLMPSAARTATQATRCFAELAAAFESALRRRVDGLSEKLRATPEIRESAFWRQLLEGTGQLAAALDRFATEIAWVEERLDALGESAPTQVRYLGTELGAVAGRLRAAAMALRAVADDEPAYCAWVECRPRAGEAPSLSLHRAPVDVGPLLARALFAPFATAVLTSATLAVEGRFDFLHARLGLDRIERRERVDTLRVPSPFDFAAQALLAVPRDVPEPAAAGYEAATHAALRRVVGITRGGTFALFTSYGALDRAWFELANELRAQGLLPLRQGELSRPVLLQRFRADPHAVLFATDSFWEGVDVRGDALRCVVIARLPFRVPTEPLEEARMEAIRARGGDPFTEHTLPQAAIKLQQGFGRLIRSRGDRGCVVVLDSRMARKPYGRVLFDSLPPARRCVGSSAEVFAALEEFFAAPA